MKILYHHRTGAKDGQAVHIEELIHALRAQGHEVVVVSPAGDDRGATSGRFAALRRRLPKFVYELLEVAYNVPVYLKLSRAVREHSPDVLYERHNLYLYSGALLAWRYRLPYLLEVNSPMAIERATHGGLVFQRFARVSENWVWRRADLVLPVTRVLGSIVEASGVKASRIAIVPNGIDPTRFVEPISIDKAKAALGIASGVTVLGFTGFVREWNAVDRVIRLIERPGNEHLFLLMVGDGPARRSLESLAESLGVDGRVRFTGVVGRDDVARYVAAFDVALQPAANPYASPLKLIEYLALGRAVVAPDQSNLREILQHGANAVLFDPNADDGLEKAISLLVSDPTLRARIGAAARATVERENLTWENNARRVAALADRIVEQRSGRPVTA